jgi:hypothetical protein
MDDSPVAEIRIARTPKKTEWKPVGGGDRDRWNQRLLELVPRALPVNQANTEALSHAGSAVMAGVVDMKPTDPIEGISRHIPNICSSLTRPHER